MTPTIRTLALGVAAIALAICGAGSVASYRPDDVTRQAQALAALKRALSALDDETLESTARLAAYREGLSEADALLCRAIRSNPTDARSIERLAVVRWESGVLAGNPNADAVSSLMSIASTQAPRVPEIQADLGELLYKMGRADDAMPYMARALA